MRVGHDFAPGAALPESLHCPGGRWVLPRGFPTLGSLLLLHRAASRLGPGHGRCSSSAAASLGIAACLLAEAGSLTEVHGRRRRLPS